MEFFCLIAAIVVMALGLLGTVLPFVPGTTVILAAAVLHRLVLGPGKSVPWSIVCALIALTLLSYAADFFGSWLGAQRFGATRWGMCGAFLGGVAGIFASLPGVILGPIIGAFAGELLGGRRLVDAGRASWGALLGNLAAMFGKVAIALAMIAIFLFGLRSSSGIFR